MNKESNTELLKISIDLLKANGISLNFVNIEKLYNELRILIEH